MGHRHELNMLEIIDSQELSDELAQRGLSLCDLRFQVNHVCSLSAFLSGSDQDRFRFMKNISKRWQASQPGRERLLLSSRS
jgi:hypothetical protein